MKRQHTFLYIKENLIANLKADIARNYLGFLWWFIEPILMMAVFYAVFGVLFQSGGDNFVQVLLVGIVFWIWFASSVGKSAPCIFNARILLSHVYFPKFVLPSVIIMEGVVRQILVVAVLLVFLALTTGVFLSWIWLPVVFIVQLIFTAAVGFWVAAVVPFIPDLRLVIPPVLQALMFCSGVFYRTINIPDGYQTLLLYNPVANLITQYRSALIDGQSPDTASLAIIALLSAVFLFFAVLFLEKNDLQYPRLAN
jgi:lipopolysaccharide transport system permease protein